MSENSDIQSNNKRIAKNTMMLYIRMFISLAVSLYTSRVVLQTLGITDYGIYNVVGGVVAMFSFISSTMASATSRFLTYEIGKNNNLKLKQTFSASFWVHIIIAGIILLLSETIGLWFLSNKMVIPEERMLAAHIVFQLSIVTTIISILRTPYNATLFAHERLDVYAYIEMTNVSLRLGILFILVVGIMDKLILYGILMFALSFGVSLFYYIYCRKHFEECAVSTRIDKSILKSMLTFSGWDFYGNMSVTFRTQGVDMLLNVFFGPVMNAASGIAANVQNAVLGFANNVTTAVRPQIIKYYAQGELKQMESLVNNACKFNFLILTLLMAPICSEINYILQLWLGTVPDYAAIFCVLALCFNLFSNLSYVVVTGIHAYGRIVRPSLINGTLYLFVIPITYVCFSLGGSAWIPFFINVCAVTIGMLSNVYTLHKYIPEYSVATFFKDVLVRCLFLLLVAVVVIAVIRTSDIQPSILRLMLTCFLTTITIGLVGWFTLLSKNFRNKISSNIKNRICKKG